MEFKAGDVVVLMSGGPSMTVKGTLAEKERIQLNALKMAGYKPTDIECQWFDEKSELKTSYFKPEVLKKTNNQK